jgi:hypothetical protein
MSKDDIARIPDTYGGEFSGWLYKNSQTMKSSWSRRYIVIKGSYIFFFHNPQNDRPIGIIPLENCDLTCPR